MCAKIVLSNSMLGISKLYNFDSLNVRKHKSIEIKHKMIPTHIAIKLKY